MRYSMILGHPALVACFAAEKGSGTGKPKSERASRRPARATGTQQQDADQAQTDAETLRAHGTSSAAGLPAAPGEQPSEPQPDDPDQSVIDRREGSLERFAPVDSIRVAAEAERRKLEIGEAQPDPNDPANQAAAQEAQRLQAEADARAAAGNVRVQVKPADTEKSATSIAREQGVKAAPDFVDGEPVRVKARRFYQGKDYDVGDIIPSFTGRIGPTLEKVALKK